MCAVPTRDGVVIAARNLDAVGNGDTMRPMPRFDVGQGAISRQNDVARPADSLRGRQVQAGKFQHVAAQHFGERLQFAGRSDDPRRGDNERSAGKLELLRRGRQVRPGLSGCRRCKD